MFFYVYRMEKHYFVLKKRAKKRSMCLPVFTFLLFQLHNDAYLAAFSNLSHFCLGNRNEKFDKWDSKFERDCRANLISFGLHAEDNFVNVTVTY